MSSKSGAQAQLPLTWPSSNKTARRLPGLLLAATIAAISIWAAGIGVLHESGISALTLAIGGGIVFGNTLFPRIAAACHGGVGFAKQQLLRLGIVLYGLRITLQQIGDVGVAAIVIDALVLTSTFSLAYWVGTRCLKMDERTVILIGAGSAICGAAAVMAAEPVVRARSSDTAIAVSTVVVFGTLAMCLYPLLYTLNQHWQLLDNSAFAFGVFTGSTVHEVAQVVAIGKAIGESVTDTAVISKMIRIMMLAPFLVCLSLWLMKKQGKASVAAGQDSQRITIPWFALLFVCVAGINSLGVMPSSLIAPLLDFDTFLLATAMAALGLHTDFSAIRRAGPKALLLATVLFVYLVVGGSLINKAMFEIDATFSHTTSTLRR